MNVLSNLCHWLDRVAEWTGRAVSWLVLVMVLVGAYNAVARYGGRFIGFELSSNSLLETQWYLFSVVFLLCAPWTLKMDEHVRVDVLYGRLSETAKAWVNALGGVLLLLPFCAFALIYTWPGVVESWEIREQSPDPGGLPRYPLKTVVPVAFILLALQGISETLRRVITLLSANQGRNTD